MEKFFKEYSHGRGCFAIQHCDFALFPVCTGSHWFLFVVDLNKMRAFNIDHIRDDGDTEGLDVYPQQYYIIVSNFPFNLLNSIYLVSFPR